MLPYDSTALAEVEKWKQRRLESESRRTMPGAWRQRLSDAGGAARDRFAGLPGADRFEEIFLGALRGLTDLGARAARASVRRQAVVRAYRKRGHDVAVLTDIRRLALADIDQVKPRLDVAYILASTVQGAGTGLVVSGGQLVAAGGGALGGTGAAPGLAAVIGAMAADAAAVLITSQRAVAHIAAYYGYDVDQPQERLYALGVLSVGTAPDRGKLAAYLELVRIGQRLGSQPWAHLGGNTVTTVVERANAILGRRLTQRKLGQAVPVAGAVIGAGLNARLLSKIVDDADNLYRERFLREKYGLDAAPTPASFVGDDALQLAEILDAEIVDEG